ncbi:hypothetical protein BPAE_0152g00070 [Botrytis paeoniae]|uniref:Uncharacterized protein n=1 Tax=Botrytis paeoniae TaxID=278948 RepID=A0A4Z1FJ88_9HELO|nr:hypothetical protein BPAE_0152g00070 [Botrytis paeoniae]
MAAAFKPCSCAAARRPTGIRIASQSRKEITRQRFMWKQEQYTREHKKTPTGPIGWKSVPRRNDKV